MLPACIPPLIQRHVQDAAFYWQQLDTSQTEPGLRAQRLLHFARLLAAHLEGLEVAGPAGLSFALEALERWRKPGEAFAASHAALCAVAGRSSPEDALPGAMAPVLANIGRAPDLLLRGLISALARAPAPTAEAFCAVAWNSKLADPVHAVAALRACALRGDAVPAEILTTALTHAHGAVRAAACRAAGSADTAALLPLLGDAELAVRAEAAIALGPAQTLQAAGTLWQAVATQSALAQSATGWNRLQAQRRLARWLSHLALLAPLAHPDLPALLAHLPLREALRFVLVHGDPAHLPFVLQALQDPEQARWAGFVWQSLTGVEIEAEGLDAPEPPIALDAPLTRSRRDADQGLPLPNTDAIAAHPINASLAAAAGTAVLQGQARSPERLRELLLIETNAPQLLRTVAAQVWNTRALGPRVTLRADALSLLRHDVELAANTETIAA